MAYRMKASLMTLSDIQGHSPTTVLFKCDFVQLCSSWQVFNRYSTSPVPYVVADLHVNELHGTWSIRMLMSLATAKGVSSSSLK